LLKSFHKLSLKHDNVRLVLVGDGEVFAELESLVNSLNLESLVTLTGRVSQAEVGEYYSVMDICVIPRMRQRVCELVTPLKPLETMACKKALVVSDLPALNELVGDGLRGVVFEPEDVDDLSLKLEQLLLDSNMREVLAERAYSWVHSSRKWSDVVGVYKDAYDFAAHSIS
jgi:glycosyltransferase involved in cell wall biosynthesis